MIRRPATLLLLLTSLNLLNYLDRFVLSAVLPKVQDDLHLSNEEGGLLATIFLIGYFATSPIFGNLGDRVARGGRKRLIALGIGVWSAATAASGLSRTAATLVAARATVGVGEASYATLAPTLVDEVAPEGRKGRWLAVFYAAIPVGSALGYIVGGAVERAYGWRSAFLLAGGPGIAAALLCLLVVEPERPVAPARPDVAGSVRTLLGIPLYRGALAGYCAHTFALGGFAYWAPTYLSRRYGLEVGTASFRFGLVSVLGGAVGTLGGGWLGDAFGRRWARGATGDARVDAGIAAGNISLCALSAALAAPLAAVAIFASTADAFLLAVFPCEVALFVAIGGPINVATLRSAPPRLQASAMALSIFGIHALGDLWSPPLIGRLADRAPWQVALLPVPLMFALASVLWWLTARAARLGADPPG
ncbi:MAG TPA: MFS transporter [Polyangiaceae bacterium]|nr:MFS transporter [Polyangiaceae bacterium]